MKKIICSLLIFITLAFSTKIFPQTPPPPNGGNDPNNPGSGNTPVGGGAPIGSGMILLIALSATYGLKKHINKKLSSMKNLSTLLLLIFLVTQFTLNAQVSITSDGSSAHPSAMLEIKSDQKGFLPPRMTLLERDNIETPIAGLTIWCSNCDVNGEMQVYNGSEWTNMIGGIAAKEWVCGDLLIDPRDNKKYKTILLGNQCWTNENLNVGTHIDGSINQADNSIIEKYCYDDDEINCDIYGGLYRWDELMQYGNMEESKGICPDGWHIPTETELNELSVFLFEANSLRMVSNQKTNQDISLISDITTSHSFEAIFSGFIDNKGLYSNVGVKSYWWTSTKQSLNSAYGLEITNAYNNMILTNDSKQFGKSVRCIKN